MAQLLEKVLRIYTCAMAGEVRSPMPHLFGPPGVGKSTVVRTAAEMLGVNLRIVNLSRVSPLEIEGVQMPDLANKKVEPLLSTYWSGLKDGDILLFDEFLRAFPETYNGTLDIMTERIVGHHKLPNIMIMGASNSTVAYDPALEDRLLHIPVPDIRKDKRARKEVAQRFASELGMLPEIAGTSEMEALLTKWVDPTYAILDNMGKGAAKPANGKSLRHLKGEAMLREISTPELIGLIELNNIMALKANSLQSILLINGKNVDSRYVKKAKSLVGNQYLTPAQAKNLAINIQLMEAEDVLIKSTELKENDDDILALS